MLCDQIVEGGEQGAVGAVGADDEGGGGAGNVLRGHIDGDVTGVGSGVAGGDDKFGRVCGIGRAEGSGLAGDAGIDLAVTGTHGELDDLALRDAGLRGHLRSGDVGRAEDEVAVGICGRI